MVHPKWYPNFDLYDLEMLMDKSSGEKPVGMTQVIWDAMGFNENASFLGFFWTMGQAKTPQKKPTFPTKFHHMFLFFLFFQCILNEKNTMIVVVQDVIT